jgi:hypothetical protein
LPAIKSIRYLLRVRLVQFHTEKVNNESLAFLLIGVSEPISSDIIPEFGATAKHRQQVASLFR